MSDGLRIPAASARGQAEAVRAELVDLCERIEIAGSLRRRKPAVGDVELVAQPRQARELLARLDTWVTTGKIARFRYSDGNARWGERYRGFIVAGGTLRFELFLADADNWGYQLWLRTGPGDANTYVMSQLKSHDAPYRPSEGYWSYNRRRLHVPSEIELFRLLGMPLVAPEARSVALYQRYLTKPTWADMRTLTYAAAAEESHQTSLL